MSFSKYISQNCIVLSRTLHSFENIHIYAKAGKGSDKEVTQKAYTRIDMGMKIPNHGISFYSTITSALHIISKSMVSSNFKYT